MQNPIIAHELTTLPIVEWSGLRVITTEFLATGYGTEATNIRTNLSAHKHRFVEGVHYFTLSGKDLTDLRVSNTDAQISSKVRSLTLYTEKGAARMSKIVDTDEAWAFFEKLESAYFHPQQHKPMSQAELIAAMAQLNVVQEKRLHHVEQEVEQIKQGTIPQGYQGYSYLQTTYGLSNAKSKQLVMAWSVPHKKVPHVAPGGQVTQMSVVNESNFHVALITMMNEAEQRGTQWYHPKMGRFSITGWQSAA